MIFPLLDYAISYFISVSSSASLPQGLFFNKLLFGTTGLKPYLNSIGFPIWGIAQFYIYLIILIILFELWISFRTEQNRFVKDLKFSGIIVYFIFFLSLLTALILSFAGLADASGNYTMNILVVRICIGLLLLNGFFSAIIFYKSFFSN